VHDGESSSELVDAFWTVARRLRHVSAEALARWDLSPSQARALSVLARHGGMRPGELARHLRIAPRSATEVVDGLTDRGLVERIPDPDDRRATQLRLTDAGTRTAEGIRTSRGEELGELFGHLSATDRAELARLLGELRRHAERDERADLPGRPVDGARSSP
jgi:DNA-binding MarR family transcriptional regulator